MFFALKPRFLLSSFAVPALLAASVGFASPGFAQEVAPETAPESPVTETSAPESAEESNPIAELPDAPENKKDAEKAAPAVAAESIQPVPQSEPQTEGGSVVVGSEIEGGVEAAEVAPVVPGIPIAPSFPTVNNSSAAGALAPDDGWDILDQPRKIESEKAPVALQPIKARVQSPFSPEPLRTIAARHNLALPLPQGRVVVDKSERRLDIYNGKTLIKSYRVALGSQPNGHKVKQGDGRTPEGDFYICTRNAKTSAFHIFLGLSYPALPDAKRAVNSKQITWREYQIIHQRLASRGRPPWETNLGGWVGIHGGTDASFAQKKRRERGNSDWTAGCIALTNREIEEIHAATRLGTPVKVQP